MCAPVVMSNKLKQINQATLMSDHLLIKIRSVFFSFGKHQQCIIYAPDCYF